MGRKFLMVMAVMALFALSACGGAATPTAKAPDPTDAQLPVVTEEENLSEEVLTAEAEATDEAEAAATEEELEDEATDEAEVDATEESSTAGTRSDATEEADAVGTGTEEADAATEADTTDEADATEAADATKEAADATSEAVNSDLAIPTSWTCPEGFEGQTLSIYNWATYIGDNTVPVFEELCGVTVEYTIYDSDEALISRLQQGNPGFDVAFPTDYAVSILLRQDLLGTIDLNNIPNFANVNPSVVNQAFDPNNAHSVPYLLGTTGIAYNVEAFPNGFPTWADFFAAEGRIAWLESPRALLGFALIQLGYDPNTIDPAQIDEARDYLIEHGSNVVTVAADDGDALLVQGEVDAVVEYGGDVYQQIAECGCDDFSFSNPVDGALLDITSVVLLNDAPNPELAQVFMDYLLDPAVAAHNTNQLGYATPNQAAIDQGLIDPEIADSPALNVSEEAQANAWFTEDVGDNDILYTQAWDEVKVNLGN